MLQKSTVRFWERLFAAGTVLALSLSTFLYVPKLVYSFPMLQMRLLQVSVRGLFVTVNCGFGNLCNFAI